MSAPVHVVNVFSTGTKGGNPAPIVVNADGMTDDDMRAIARRYGHESGFVVTAPKFSDCDIGMRYWVPNHEMPMCGHATVGGIWLLCQLNLLHKDEISIWTKSGIVRARIVTVLDRHQVEVSQPKGLVEGLLNPEHDEAEILSVLGITSNELAPLPVQNAATSRIKTLIPLKNVHVLNGLKPDFKRMEQLCERIGSTGLYPYAISDLRDNVFDARQFPRSSGYPEDAATGIAAAALAFGLLKNGLVPRSVDRILIRQGRVMGRPSEISVRFDTEKSHGEGCWIGGNVRLEPNVAEPSL